MSENRAAALDAATFFRHEETLREAPSANENKTPALHSAPAPQKRYAFWERLRGKVAGAIGLDLGSQNTVISIEGDGVVFSEPSVVAVRGDKIIAAGRDAKEMIGRAQPRSDRSAGTEVLYPLRQGVIADFDHAREMIKIFLKRSRPFPFSPGHVAVAIPGGVTEVDRRAIDEAVMQAGAAKVTLVDEGLAAALGSGFDIESPCGRFIVSLGSGATQAGLISLGEVVHSTISATAGRAIDEMIASYLKSEHDFLVGEQTVEEIKIALASAMPEPEERKLIVHGRGISGPPRSIVVTSSEISKAIAPAIDEIVAMTLRALEAAPPELAGDIVRGGILLTGGGALIRGLSQRVERDTGLNVRIADDPEHVVSTGARLFAGRNRDSVSAV